MVAGWTLGTRSRWICHRPLGRAVAADLRNGRPPCATRRVFVRAIAPYRGYSSTMAVCDYLALDAAGLAAAQSTGAIIEVECDDQAV